MTIFKTTMFDIYGRSLEIAEADVQKAYAKAMNDRPDFDIAVSILTRDGYETRCIPTADGKFAFLPDRLPFESLYRYAHRMKKGNYPIRITEEVFLAAFPELSQEEKARVHAIFRPGEGTLPRISKILVKIPSLGLFGRSGNQIEVTPVLPGDRDRICKMLDSEGVLSPQGTRFSQDQIPFAFAHTKWVLGDWIHKNTSIRVPAPKSNESWLVDLVFHSDQGCFVAIPVSMNIPDQKRIRVEMNPRFNVETMEVVPVVPADQGVPADDREVRFSRHKAEFAKSFIVPQIQDAFAYLDPDVVIRLLAKVLLSLRTVARENPGDVESNAKLAGLEETIMIAPDIRSGDDVKVAVLKNDKGEWHIVDDSGPIAGPFAQDEALKIFLQK